MTIDYCRTADGFRVTLLITPRDKRTAFLLAGRIERVVTVTNVEIVPVDPDSPSLPHPHC
ncbi:hypothetical protein [Novosphingobium sp. 9U]|uniref:hypothetical protein n=1 Tax=Novosphingobium sp. 9U TaxID=2653158 RepID=UPI0012F0A720|nr:hypothetical protein [Novosphingobium sp. 9U]VWX49905.1 hypothetical protein NOVOSPHI9U_260083 [Novosphingobium sp. 9U]